jgi:hypothetical protein
MNLTLRFTVGFLLVACYLFGYQFVELCVKFQQVNRAELNLIYERLDYLEKPRNATE